MHHNILFSFHFSSFILRERAISYSEGDLIFQLAWFEVEQLKNIFFADTVQSKTIGNKKEYFRLRLKDFKGFIKSLINEPLRRRFFLVNISARTFITLF